MARPGRERSAQRALAMHQDLTLAEAAARLAGDFAADIAAYDRVHAQILEMADMLTSGFPAGRPQAG